MMINRMRWLFFCAFQLLCLAVSISLGESPAKHPISMQQERASSEIEDSGTNKKPPSSEEKSQKMYNSDTDWKDKITLGKRATWYIPEYIRTDNDGKIDSEKLRGMWGKKNNWNNLNGMWGKRDLSAYEGDEGKRSDWNNLSGMWGKRSDWNNLSGLWGKRSDWNNLSGMWGKRDVPDVESSISDDGSSKDKKNFKKNWNGLQGMWGKRSTWNNLNGMWGKRSDWNNLSGMWGKRSVLDWENRPNANVGNDKKNFKKNWNGLQGMWGKRSAWNNLNGMWGKRLQDDAQMTDDHEKRTEWNKLNGMWGKRDSDSHIYFAKPDMLEENTSLQDEI